MEQRNFTAPQQQREQRNFSAPRQMQQRTPQPRNEGQRSERGGQGRGRGR
jgi:hypothetical protein